MPVLQITSCEQCPFHRILREEWMDDCYTVLCKHPDQTSESASEEGFNHKMKFSNSVYFKCPLDEPKDSEDEDY